MIDKGDKFNPNAFKIMKKEMRQMKTRVYTSKEHLPIAKIRTEFYQTEVSDYFKIGFRFMVRNGMFTLVATCRSEHYLNQLDEMVAKNYFGEGVSIAK